MPSRISATEIFKELKCGRGSTAPKYRTIAEWVSRYRYGRQSLKDDPRIGRPNTVFTKTNIDRVQTHIQNDPHATVSEMEEILCINRFTLLEIIHGPLKMRKLTSRWIPHNLTAKNRKERVEACKENLAKFESGKWRLSDVVTSDEFCFYWRQIDKKRSQASWVGENEKPRTVVKRDRYEPKSVITVFFKTTGLVHLDCLDNAYTITGTYYINNCLMPLVKNLNEQGPLSATNSIKLLNDNAKPHVKKEVLQFLDANKIARIRHPPYSPDLSPCDFWLFDYIKRNLSDHTSAESLKSEITEILRNIPESEYRKTFKKYLERMKLCIQNKGEYFEHLTK
jgi:histone-lysine N-methyltransferase SETMAR